MKHYNKQWAISTGRYNYPIEIWDTYAFSHSYGTKKFDHIPTREDVRNWLLVEERNKYA